MVIAIRTVPQREKSVNLYQVNRAVRGIEDGVRTSKMKAGSNVGDDDDDDDDDGDDDLSEYEQDESR